MPEVKSIRPALLEDAANFVADEVSYVLINDTITVSEFKLKEVTNNVISIEYIVTPDMTSIITDIKLMRADGEALSQIAVYVPVPQTIVSKHLITVKEGT